MQRIDYSLNLIGKIISQMKEQNDELAHNLLLNFIQKINLKCVGMNQLYQFCINQKCKEIDSFVCNNEECECNVKHQCCQKGQIKFVMRKVNLKVMSKTSELKKEVNKIFTSLINQISQFQKIIQKDIQNQLKFCTLFNVQKQFYEVFSKKNKKIQQNQMAKNYQNYGK